MSWHYLQEQVAASWEENSLDGAPSALLKLMPTASACCSHDSAMECCHDSRSGMMCGHSTGTDGAAASMSSAAVSPAKTSVPLATEQESPESVADCGPKWPASFARYNPGSRSWKTRQCLLLGGLASFSETWPNSGMMRDGECSVLPDAERLTSDDESGLWQTPVADDAVERENGKINSRGEPKLSAQVKLWPTPRASDGSKGGRVTPRKSREGGTLIEAVSARTKWPTPRANDAEKRGNIDLTNPRNGLAAADGQTSGGMLNPRWVEWLQGWPIAWTSLEPLETDKFQQWLDAHGCNSAHLSPTPRRTRGRR